MIPDARDNRPPGRVTRAISPTPAAGSCHEVDDELGKGSIECVIRERQLLRGAEPNIDARVAARAASTNGSDGSIAATESAPTRATSSVGERARPAADVEHPLSGCDPREIGELRARAARSTVP